MAPSPPRLGISPPSSTYFSSPFRDDSRSVSPKTEHFSVPSSNSSSSASLSALNTLNTKLPGPFGRTRALTGRAGRRVFWGLVVVFGLVTIYSRGIGFAPGGRADGTHHYSPGHGGDSRRLIDIASDPLPLDATLGERLDAWARAPGHGGEGEGGVDPSTFVGWNSETCGEEIMHNVSPHMLNTQSIHWAQLNKTAIGALRTELIDYMRSVADGFEMQLAHRLTGHGVVMLAGDGTSLNRVLWSVSMMRSYGSDLPVNVYCFEDEYPNLDPDLVRQLEALNATIVPVDGIAKAEKGKKSYHLKAHGIIAAPFRHVLYLDSDSIPVRDPSYMWDAPNYVRLGVYMTPDYWKTAPSNPIWAIAGVKCRNEWENEAGQILVDKGRHMDALLLSRYMLENHDQWFQFSDGDKDILLRWTLIMLRKRWGVPGRYVAAGALPRDTPTGFCGHSMMQHDSWGGVFTCHWNLLKNIPSGTALGNTWGRSLQLPLFNQWPGTPDTVRLGEPTSKPDDTHVRGIGDIDCDMLADADEYGYARAPATEMVMRRAAREQGVQAFFHGGGNSAFCISMRYLDPRSKARQAEFASEQKEGEAAYEREHEAWAEEASLALDAGRAPPPEPQYAVQPDWSDPFEIVNWRNDEHLKTFEDKLWLNFKFDPHWKPPKEEA